jgi:hypothetical protein
MPVEAGVWKHQRIDTGVLVLLANSHRTVPETSRYFPIGRRWRKYLLTTAPHLLASSRSCLTLVLAPAAFTAMRTMLPVSQMSRHPTSQDSGRPCLQLLRVLPMAPRAGLGVCNLRRAVNSGHLARIWVKVPQVNIARLNRKETVRDQYNSPSTDPRHNG